MVPMFMFLVTFFAGVLVLVAAEIIRRKKGYSNEAARKLVHALHGVLAGIWPFFIGLNAIIVIEVLFIVWGFIAQRLGWFRWLERVGRKSWGEYWFPVGIIVAALIADSLWVYFAAALILGLADAVAAVVGKKFGKHPYKVFGQNKSLQGSLAFFVVAFIVLMFIFSFSPVEFRGVAVLTALWLAAVLTVTENLGVYGFDNFLLPVLSVVILNMLS